MNSRSLDALRAYIEDLGRRGAFTDGTVRSYLTSIDRVFRDVPNVESVDVLSVDLDKLLADFRESALQDGFELVSIHSYEGRAKAAIKRFRRHIEAGTSEVDAEHSAGAAIPGSSAKNSLRVPLRPGLAVEVTGLPFDITPAEARRIANVIIAMAELD